MSLSNKAWLHYLAPAAGTRMENADVHFAILAFPAAAGPP